MIKDSGERREFDTGAVRDIQKGKGRCDLMPLGVVGSLLHDKKVVFRDIDAFVRFGDTGYLLQAIRAFVELECVPSTHNSTERLAHMLLEVSVHFEEGADKYGENNWQKGLPAQCYIDSAVRHYLKFMRGDDDERHDRAFVWNLMCCIWTCQHRPELNSYAEEEKNK